MSKVGRAVWSYWSRPMADAGSAARWLGTSHHLMSWVLSVETARQHFSSTGLVTDTAGAALLVDELGLPFDEVSTSLDELPPTAAGWWGLGKLMAYGCQAEPFIHVDSDVYLWSPLPDRLLTAPVLGQNLESFTPGASYYTPEVLEDALAHGGWLPDEWLAIRSRGLPALGAVCCGIVGGTDLDFLRHYASQAAQMVIHPRNQPLLAQLTDAAEHMILPEQFLLWACLEYHRKNPTSRFASVDIDYLFASESHAYQGAATSAYTHLIGPAKKNPLVTSRLERRVHRQFPALAARIDHIASRAVNVG